jgi:hypothetical protein
MHSFLQDRVVDVIIQIFGQWRMLLQTVRIRSALIRFEVRCHHMLIHHIVPERTDKQISPEHADGCRSHQKDELPNKGKISDKQNEPDKERRKQSIEIRRETHLGCQRTPVSLP